MSRLVLKLAVAGGLLVGLAACGGDKNGGSASNGGGVTPTPPPTARFANFGNGFATDFAAGANTEPVAVTAADANAVNNTSEPSPVT